MAKNSEKIRKNGAGKTQKNIAHSLAIIYIPKAGDFRLQTVMLPINEGIILKALKEQKNKKSIILVSHRESTMAIADRIYKVENGRMTEAA